MKLKFLGVLFGLTFLGLTAQAQASLTITWTDNSTNETGFAIERAPAAPSTTFVEVGRVAANVVTFVDSSVAPATTYQYRIRAFNATDFSAYSNIASGTTRAGINAPSGATVTQPITVTLNQPSSKVLFYTGSLAYSGAGKVTLAYSEIQPLVSGQQGLVIVK